MGKLEEFEVRLTTVEQQLAPIRQDAAAARVLAQAADRDVSEFRMSLNAHTRLLNALRETQVEQGERMNQGFTEMRGGFTEMNQGFTKLNFGMAHIVALLTEKIDATDK